MIDDRPVVEGEVINDGDGGTFVVPSYSGSVPREVSLTAPGAEGASIGLSYLEAGGEIFITSTDPGAAADQAGIVPGSKMLSINGQPLVNKQSQDHIHRELSAAKQLGKGVVMKVLPPAGSGGHQGIEEGKIVEFEGKTFTVPAYQNKIYDAYLSTTAGGMGLTFVNCAGDALVATVEPGGVAEKVGIPATSRIKSLNGVKIGGPNVHEQVMSQVQASRNARKPLLFTFQPPVGCVINESILGGSESSDSYSYSDGTTLDPERQHLIDKLSPLIMSRFDVDKDKLLSYEEYSELNRVFRRQQVTRDDFDYDFPKGFTRLNLYEELSVYSKEDLEHLLRILEKGKYAPTTTSGKSFTDRSASSVVSSSRRGASESSGGFRDYDVTQYHLQQHHPPEPVTEPIGIGPYPSIWKSTGQDKNTLTNGIDRFVRVDLRNDDNATLKNALLLMGRELENRLAESVESHTMLENALDNLNNEAVGRFGFDLETLLARPEKRGEANAWAGARMREIPLPARLIRSYEMAGGAAGVLKSMREEPETASSSASTSTAESSLFRRPHSSRPAPRGSARYRRRDRVPWQNALI